MNEAMIRDSPWPWMLAVPALLFGASLVSAAPPAEPEQPVFSPPLTLYVSVPPLPVATEAATPALGRSGAAAFPCLIHHAEPDDSWWRIAERANLDPYRLLVLNNATPETLILIGDPICLPPGTVITSPATTTSVSVSEDSATNQTAPANTDTSTTNPAPTHTHSSTPPSTSPPPTSSSTPPTTTTSSSGQWTGPIPEYRPGSACSRANAGRLASVFADHGASRETQEWALLVVSRESGCDHTARNNNPSTRDDSFGLCQLNALAGFFDSGGLLADFDRWQMLTDFDYAAHGCAHLWQECGRGPWNYGNYYCKEPSS